MSLTLAIDVSGQTVQLDFNRPDDGNAMTLDMMRELSAVIAEHGAHAETRVIVLRARGDQFCRGRDTSGGPPPGAPRPPAYDVRHKVMGAVLGVYEAIAACPAPVIALVQGDAFGFGCAMATIADITIASDKARFGFPEIEHGIPPALAMASAIRNMPPKALTWLVYSAERISAAQAKEVGIVSRVFGHDSFQADSEAAVRSLAGRSRLVLETIKRYQSKATGLPLDIASEYAGTLLALGGTAAP
jgi:enoyl-CoA hydratase/carnithine racemase